MSRHERSRSLIAFALPSPRLVNALFTNLKLPFWAGCKRDLMKHLRSDYPLRSVLAEYPVGTGDRNSLQYPIELDRSKRSLSMKSYKKDPSHLPFAVMLLSTTNRFSPEVALGHEWPSPRLDLSTRCIDELAS
jgi:hypothetical protein